MLVEVGKGGQRPLQIRPHSPPAILDTIHRLQRGTRLHQQWLDFLREQPVAIGRSKQRIGQTADAKQRLLAGKGGQAQVKGVNSALCTMVVISALWTRASSVV